MQITDEIRLKAFRKYDKDKSVFEKALYRYFYKALQYQVQFALKYGTVNEDTLYSAYLNSFDLIFRKYGKKPVQTLLKKDLPNLSIGFFNQIFREKVKKYLFESAGTRIKQVNETTKESIRKVLEKNTLTGARKTSRVITKELSNINKKRALLIARTESLTAMNYIQHDTAIKQGVTTKAWLHTIGKSIHFREEHLAIGETPIGINESWTVNGLKMMYPGDPNGGAINNCNCRCTLLYGYSTSTKPNFSNLFTQFVAGLIGAAIIKYPNRV